MNEQHKLLLAIIRGATELIDYDLSSDQLDRLRFVVEVLDLAILFPHESV